MASGKTTCAEILNALLQSVEIASYATPLKICVGDLFQFTPEQLYTFEGKEAIDPRYGVSPRKVMQQFGTEFVRTTVPDLWITLMKQRISRTVADMFVIDDVRFNDECALVRQMGGTVIHIDGRGKKSGHSSERGVTRYTGDLAIDNTRSLEMLAVTVEKLFREIQDETD